jgi:hypothetical protein
MESDGIRWTSSTVFINKILYIIVLILNKQEKESRN